MKRSQVDSLVVAMFAGPINELLYKYGFSKSEVCKVK